MKSFQFENFNVLNAKKIYIYLFINDNLFLKKYLPIINKGLNTFMK